MTNTNNEHIESTKEAICRLVEDEELREDIEANEKFLQFDRDLQQILAGYISDRDTAIAILDDAISVRNAACNKLNEIYVIKDVADEIIRFVVGERDLALAKICIATNKRETAIIKTRNTCIQNKIVTLKKELASLREIATLKGIDAPKGIDTNIEKYDDLPQNDDILDEIHNIRTKEESGQALNEAAWAQINKSRALLERLRSQVEK